MEIAWGIDHVVDWERQKRVLHESLRTCRESMNHLPVELTVWPQGNPYGDQQGHMNGHDPFSMTVFGQRDPSLINTNDTEPTHEERRRMQYEIQKANVYASSLCTR